MGFRKPTGGAVWKIGDQFFETLPGGERVLYTGPVVGWGPDAAVTPSPTVAPTVIPPTGAGSAFPNAPQGWPNQSRVPEVNPLALSAFRAQSNPYATPFVPSASSSWVSPLSSALSPGALESNRQRSMSLTEPPPVNPLGRGLYPGPTRQQRAAWDHISGLMPENQNISNLPLSIRSQFNTEADEEFKKLYPVKTQPQPFRSQMPGARRGTMLNRGGQY